VGNLRILRASVRADGIFDANPLPLFQLQSPAGDRPPQSRCDGGVSPLPTVRPRSRTRPRRQRRRRDPSLPEGVSRAATGIPSRSDSSSDPSPGPRREDCPAAASADFAPAASAGFARASTGFAAATRSTTEYFRAEQYRGDPALGARFTGVDPPGGGQRGATRTAGRDPRKRTGSQFVARDDPQRFTGVATGDRLRWRCARRAVDPLKRVARVRTSRMGSTIPSPGRTVRWGRRSLCIGASGSSPRSTPGTRAAFADAGTLPGSSAR